MATSANLMGSEVHKVQEMWTGQKAIRAAHCMTKHSPKDIHFFRIMLPTESPKIMGLMGIHSPEALQWWGGLSFCPWCRKGQNEGMVVNPPTTLAITTWDSFAAAVWNTLPQVPVPCTGTTSCVSQHWPALMTITVTWEEESVDDDNGREYDNEFAFYKD